MAPLQPADNSITLSAVDVVKLNTLLTGDVVYFTLKDGRGYETIQYTHTGAITAALGTNTVPVTRAALGTVRKAWALKSCVQTAITEAVLNLFICQKITGGC
jgi:hypothetical protein